MIWPIKWLSDSANESIEFISFVVTSSYGCRVYWFFSQCLFDYRLYTNSFVRVQLTGIRSLFARIFDLMPIFNFSSQNNTISEGAEGYTPDQFSSLDVEILFGTEASLDEIFDSLDSNKDSEVRFASKCFLPTASYLNCCRSSQLELVSSYNVRRSN